MKWMIKVRRADLLLTLTSEEARELVEHLKTGSEETETSTVFELRNALEALLTRETE